MARSPRMGKEQMKKKIAKAVAVICAATVIFGTSIPIWASYGFGEYLKCEGFLCGIFLVAGAFAWAMEVLHK